MAHTASGVTGSKLGGQQRSHVTLATESLEGAESHISVHSSVYSKYTGIGTRCGDQHDDWKEIRPPTRNRPRQRNARVRRPRPSKLHSFTKFRILLSTYTRNDDENVSGGTVRLHGRATAIVDVKVFPSKRITHPHEQNVIKK